MIFGATAWIDVRASE